MFTYRLDHLLVCIGVAAAVLGLGRAAIVHIETSRWRVFPDEEGIAQHVVELGGTYHVDRDKDRHIDIVWLDNSAATDEDVRLVLQLPFLKHLDVSGTTVTDAVLCEMVKHSSLRVIKVQRSKITSEGLERVIDPNSDLLLGD